MKAVSREKQEEEVKAQEETNSRHATRHQVMLLQQLESNLLYNYFSTTKTYIFFPKSK